MNIMNGQVSERETVYFFDARRSNSKLFRQLMFTDSRSDESIKSWSHILAGGIGRMYILLTITQIITSIISIFHKRNWCPHIPCMRRHHMHQFCIDVWEVTPGHLFSTLGGSGHPADSCSHLASLWTRLNNCHARVIRTWCFSSIFLDLYLWTHRFTRELLKRRSMNRSNMYSSASFVLHDYIHIT